MAYIKISENERFESALRRFKRQCENEGLLKEIKKRQYYESPSMLRKKQKDDVKRRQRMNASRAQRLQAKRSGK
ncbi:MAG: 30S ribosomal protein S21 [Elusimicrobia bacterium CG03_land_8_20_14_0_80_50_18]|nr:MAG: 30S ribosomal protein S21 [Elusimicrobia bacterium CG03_land_8_20_14_0_80_50_18]PIX15609.1 MAG: 30S ribosomal protein S21 [Elusimicrobia bacterium CG_4_8_14_3_um_filter_50_9]